MDPTAGVNGIGNTLGVDPTRNLSAAIAGMGLSAQEQALYLHHLRNLGMGGVSNPDNTRSTVYSLGFDGEDGRYHVVPSIYGNAKLSPGDAIARAQQIGLANFPSYPSAFAGENRYQRMHNYMERDDFKPRGLF